MRRVLLLALLAALPLWCGEAAAAQEKQGPPAQQPEQQKPPQEQKPPVTLSPVLPVTDPNKIAQPVPPPAGKPTGSTSTDSIYVIGPEDQLRVAVFEDSKFNGDVTVRSDGRISLPLIGEIKAAGLTPQQLEGVVNEACGKYLVSPHSSVQVFAIHSRKIYFFGDGIKNGALDYPVPMTVLEAIAAQGGFKEFAKKNKITILRDGKEIQRVKYDQVIKGRSTQQNIILQPGDHVVVPG